jgi:NAD(P)-dependent dehydrogenase (short-subunit alcohol dehydrogenase family)
MSMIKIAVITGANRGLGFATARRLGQSGVRVIVGARNLANGDEAVARLRREGLDCEPLRIDVDSPASVRGAAKLVEREHGRIDILVNNAGILPEATAPDVDRPLDLGMVRETFETNVFGTISVTNEFLPLLRRSASGRIVNVSSTMGSLTDQTDPSSPYYGLLVPAYQMSKAALNGFTIALSKALTDTSIKVNSVCPGWVQTDLGGPENRAAAPTTADEAAQIVVDMASIPDDGPTGQFVDRDGTVAW